MIIIYESASVSLHKIHIFLCLLLAIPMLHLNWRTPEYIIKYPQEK